MNALNFGSLISHHHRGAAHPQQVPVGVHRMVAVALRRGAEHLQSRQQPLIGHALPLLGVEDSRRSKPTIDLV